MNNAVSDRPTIGLSCFLSNVSVCVCMHLRVHVCTACKQVLLLASKCLLLANMCVCICTYICVCTGSCLHVQLVFQVFTPCYIKQIHLCYAPFAALVHRPKKLMIAYHETLCGIVLL